MKEQTIQKNIIKELKKHKAYIVKVVVSGTAGVPDILFCYKGMFGAIEVKTPETFDGVSELQKYNMEMIRESGGFAGVATSPDRVQGFLSIMDKKLKD